MSMAEIVGWGAKLTRTRVTNLPKGLRKNPEWVPHVGDVFPNFQAETTQGNIDFYNWADGKWTLLFNHIHVGGAVGTTEMAAFASAAQDFEQRNTQLLGLSNDSQFEQQKWESGIQRRFGQAVDFPTIIDESGDLSTTFGMTRWKNSWDHALRKTFLISPSLHVRCILEFPMNLGRGVEEILRIIDAQQLHETRQLATGADWQPGDAPIVPQYLDPSEIELQAHETMIELFPGMRVVKPRGAR